MQINLSLQTTVFDFHGDEVGGVVKQGFGFALDDNILQTCVELFFLLGELTLDFSHSPAFFPDIVLLHVKKMNQHHHPFRKLCL